VRKQVRINGVPKRALDLVGRLRVVLFLPEDVSLVAGTPAARRHYLDIALCQIDPGYCRALAEYNRALSQRNALLKRLRDYGGDSGQLNFWDAHMTEHGSLLIHRRSRVVCDLDRIATERHANLTGGSEHLRLEYLPCVDPNAMPGSDQTPGRGTGNKLRPVRSITEAPPIYRAVSPGELKNHYLAQLRQVHDREIAAGSSLLGPHRDDLNFIVNDHELRSFGSRGQQRTAALALKLAEVQMMQEATGESPFLLLDDVMSELDADRRRALLDALEGVAQAIVTTTDWGDFTPELLAQARLWQVEQGALFPAPRHSA
jgi:DNA replication and repair protein RecF